MFNDKWFYENIRTNEYTEDKEIAKSWINNGDSINFWHWKPSLCKWLGFTIQESQPSWF